MVEDVVPLGRSSPDRQATQQGDAPVKHLLELPADLLTDILQRVPASARQACQVFHSTWGAGCDTLVVLEAVNPPVQAAALQAVLKQLPALDVLQLNGASVPDLQPLTSAPCELLLVRLTDYGMTTLAPLLVHRHLTSLSLATLSQLVDLSGLDACTGLVDLRFEFCELLTDVSPLGRLPSLEQLTVSMCDMLVDVAPLTSCSRLSSLSFDSCQQLRSVAALTACKALSKIMLHSCPRVAEADALIASPQLTNVTLCRGPFHGRGLPLLSPHLTSLAYQIVDTLVDLGELASCPSLTRLHLDYCGRLADLRPLAASSRPMLLTVSLRSCCTVVDLGPLATHAPSVTELDLCQCAGLEDLSPLARCTALRSLQLQFCRRVNDVRALAGFATLTELDLSACPIASIAPLSSCRSLVTLHYDVIGDSLAGVDALAACPMLRALTLGGCSQLGDVGPLSMLSVLSGLSDLSLCGGCTLLTDIGAISTLTALTRLTIHRCSMTSIKALPSCRRLQSLSLFNCDRLTNVAGLAACSNLSELYLTGCDALHDISALACCTRLEACVLDGCSMTSLQPLAGSVASLRVVSLMHCTQCCDRALLDALRALRPSWQLEIRV